MTRTTLALHTQHAEAEVWAEELNRASHLCASLDEASDEFESRHAVGCALKHASRMQAT